MTKVDLIVLGFVALTAFIGWKKGLIASALSLAGIVLGAWLGSRLAPQLLQDGTHSPYTPLAALAGAAVGAILFETLGTLAGSAIRSKVRRRKLTTFDATGGLILGTCAGVAGQNETVVELQSGGRLPADVVAFDRRNDVAVLRVRELGLRSLPLVSARPGTPVAVLGFPENGPFSVTPARIGQTSTVLAEDAYGAGPVTRAITSLRGRVRHGDSGAPAVDAHGAVQLTVFAARLGAVGGYGVPSEVVRADVIRARGPVSSGDCAP